ncbi:MAG: bifunctional pyr operon transcriptional regulator/uracil phosphoribosyltransferase PyrR [Planctomycetes bacterium]|nr:bifunctional pyr operon transcriptional regulator/uracil phosphoribosyltransferase PyrR [Planctomycetota bacterium]
MTTAVFVDAAGVTEGVSRLAKAIQQRHAQAPVLVGIRTNGVPLAQRIAAAFAALGLPTPQLGAIDITLYRDDLGARGLPQVLGSDIPADLEGKRVVLVDDVLYTGRTVRAALTELADYGRPERIELCVLVDRGLRELPICADYVGFECKTEPGDHVKVELSESGADTDCVLLRRG